MILFAMLLATAEAAAPREAVFAGGCFWCMEPPFEALRGVLSVESGYTGGSKEKPTYREVSNGGTGHTEAVRVLFDPAVVSYETLLETYWRNVDPTVSDRQFCDVGDQYRPAIFYRGPEQQAAARRSRDEAAKRLRVPGRIVVDLSPASRFWPAEDYHQDYYRNNPIRYKFYRRGCGRDARLRELWGPPGPK